MVYQDGDRYGPNRPLGPHALRHDKRTRFGHYRAINHALPPGLRGLFRRHTPTLAARATRKLL